MTSIWLIAGGSVFSLLGLLHAVHSLGVVMFGFGCIAVGLSLRSLALPKAALPVPVPIGAIYCLLSVRYWFRAPAIGTAAGTVCLIIGWLAY
jgi:hypothetical protein